MSFSKAYNATQTKQEDTHSLTPEHAEALKQAGYPLLAAHILYELSLIENGIADKIDTMHNSLPHQNYDGPAGALAYAFGIMTGKVLKDDAAHSSYQEYLNPIRLARESFGFDPWVPHIAFMDRPKDILLSLEDRPEVQRVLNAGPIAPAAKPQSPAQRLQ